MIKFTGNLRLDFEKATAEITKLKDRILGVSGTDRFSADFGQKPQAV